VDLQNHRYLRANTPGAKPRHVSASSVRAMIYATGIDASRRRWLRRSKRIRLLLPIRFTHRDRNDIHGIG
jgi:hypothetical protein